MPRRKHPLPYLKPLRSTEQGIIRVEYETPPLRSISQDFYMNDGQNDDEIRNTFLHFHPRATIRKIERVDGNDPRLCYNQHDSAGYQFGQHLEDVNSQVSQSNLSTGNSSKE